MNAARRVFPHTVIRASAGTGKTFQLSNRFLGLIASDEPSDSILATTFTRKAAGEILARVLLRIAEAAVDGQKRRDLAEHIGEASLDRPRCLDLLAGLIRRLHRIRVCTLDSFFIQIARSFSLEMGLAPGWQIVDEVFDAHLRSEAIRAVLSEHSTGDVVRLVHLLTKGEATQSITEQIRGIVSGLYGVYLESPSAAWESLPRTKALEEADLEKAIQALESADCSSAPALNKARADGLTSLRGQQWAEFLAKGLAAKIVAGECVYSRKPIPPELAAIYEPLIRHCKARLLGQIADQTAATRRLLEHFDVAYQRLKTAHRAMRFEDITRKLCDALQTRQLDDVLYRLDGHISHLLLDEFQDTAPLQWRVLRPFAHRVVEGAKGRSFFCVGDVKQAIYGWRGGVAEIFDAIEAELKRLTPESLNRSWRCSPPVIETVNRVFANLASNEVLERYPSARAQWAARYAEHAAARQDRKGYCRLIAAPRAEEGAKQEETTWAFAAEEVARLRREAPGFSVGLLVRRNKAVARLIYELRQRGVEASEEGGNTLCDSPAVELILSLLTLADHPGDTVARFHVARSPLGSALGWTDDGDARAAWRLSCEIRARLLNQGYGPTLFGWTELLAPHCDARDLSRLEQLVEMAYEYESQATGRADDFVNLVKEKRVEDPRSADVRVMTVHQAKGLEFDIVVLPELDARLVGQTPQIVLGREGPAGEIEHVLRYVPRELRVLLPDRFCRLFDDHQRRVAEESLCVLYVALTRAVHALHMIVAPSAENEKSLHATFSGVLRAALTGGGKLAPRTIAYENGAPQWFIATEPAKPSVSPTDRSREEPWVIRLAPPCDRPSRGLDRRSPSQLEGGTRVDLRSRLRLDTGDALVRGSLVHAWFEQIEWIEEGLPSEETLQAIAKRMLVRSLNIAEQIEQFRKALDQPMVRAILSRATYEKPARGKQATPVHAGTHVVRPQWKVWRERPFAIRDGDRILNGQIDRLVVLYDGECPVGADVIDFKTDVLSAEALPDRVDHYRPQLEAYRQAASRFLGLPLEKISLRLVFVALGVVERVNAPAGLAPAERRIGN